MPEMVRKFSARYFLGPMRSLLALLPYFFCACAAAQNGLPGLSTVIEVAAFEVAPVRSVSDDLRVQPNAPFLKPNGRALVADEKVVQTRVAAGESWEDILRRIAGLLELKPDAVPSSQFQTGLLPALSPGKFLRARTPSADSMVIEYVVQADEAYTLFFDAGEMRVEPRASDPRLIERMRADPAKASLFTATDAIGLPESIALQLNDIFSGEVDFHRELHNGYRCEIVYEAHYREGFLDRSTRILAAEFLVGNRRYSAYYAQDAQGRGGYFNEAGKSTRKFFRRSPVEFTRITSDFTLARFHPILGVWRAHRGTDYAAPAGTKVIAVADGVVEFAGVRADYGNLVVLRHQDRFLTYYAHLKEIAAGIVPGAVVTQGQSIGAVGMTGLATGPHLHFEFHLRDAAGSWIPVAAPNVIETTQSAPSGFADIVERYRAMLSVARKQPALILE